MNIKKAYVSILLVLFVSSLMILLPNPVTGAELKKDMDLSESNASFWGEDGTDYSGYSVAGAGDVQSRFLCKSWEGAEKTLIDYAWQ